MIVDLYPNAKFPNKNKKLSTCKYMFTIQNLKTSLKNIWLTNLSTIVNHQLSSRSTKSSSSFPLSHLKPSPSFSSAKLTIFSSSSINERVGIVLELEAISLGVGIVLELALALVSNLASLALVALAKLSHSNHHHRI